MTIEKELIKKALDGMEFVLSDMQVLYAKSINDENMDPLKQLKIENLAHRASLLKRGLKEFLEK